MLIVRTQIKPKRILVRDNITDLNFVVVVSTSLKNRGVLNIDGYEKEDELEILIIRYIVPYIQTERDVKHLLYFFENFCERKDSIEYLLHAYGVYSITQ